MEETLHGRVIQAVPPAAHAAGDLIILQQLMIRCVPGLKIVRPDWVMWQLLNSGSGHQIGVASPNHAASRAAGLGVGGSDRLRSMGSDSIDIAPRAPDRKSVV